MAWLIVVYLDYGVRFIDCDGDEGDNSDDDDNDDDDDDGKRT